MMGIDRFIWDILLGVTDDGVRIKTFIQTGHGGSYAEGL